VARRPQPRVIDRESLDALLGALSGRGYKLIGPTVRQRAVVYDEIATSADLPVGATDEQDGGVYRLSQRADDPRLFAHNVGPTSWKDHLFPSTLQLWHARRGEDGSLQVEEDDSERPRYAFIGVRSCDLHAIGIQDRIFIHDRFTDPDYEARRQGAFIVAVSCGQSASTCFCASMDTGPAVSSGHDLALTELLDADGHRFLVEAGTPAGEEVLEELPRRDAGETDRRAAAEVVAQAASQQTRALDTTDIKDLLYRNLEHPRWDEVSERCLSCGNCTMVCPTCFCSTVEDHTDLAGDEAERVRQWDSCFSLDHSYVHGGSVRSTRPSRYRQWMTHKLGSWIDQFGTSGCVGCGRCIAWCPVAIDITEEAAAIRASDGETRADDR
jgi:ferredoxin